MQRIFLIALALSMILAAPANAQPTFSIDFQGPTPGLADGFALGIISAGDILTTPLPGLPGPNAPVPGPFGIVSSGIEIGAAALAPGVIPGGLGILPGAGGLMELDALSYGKDTGTLMFFFSVDEFATGVPGGRSRRGFRGRSRAYRRLGGHLHLPGAIHHDATGGTGRQRRRLRR